MNVAGISQVIRGGRWTVRLIGLMGCLTVAVASQATAGTFTVTTTADSGPGSLRQAILAANQNPGADVIEFGIAGTAPFTIVLLEKLPQVTGRVVIDGTSQPGYGSQPVIELDGRNAGSASGLEIVAGNSTVLGLSIYGFKDHGIKLDVAGGNQIDGCFIGTDFTGVNAIGNENHGLEIRSDTNKIGGTIGNVITMSGKSGIHVDGVTGNIIQGNLIGPDVTGVNGDGNVEDGITLDNATDTLIGGTGLRDGNTIAFSGQAGVRVNDRTGNGILGNDIFSNEGLGIDLKGNGVTPNDDGDTDNGPNNLQNFPVLTQSADAATTIVTGELHSKSNTTYRIEFFANAVCDPTGYGEGATFLKAATVTTGPTGKAAFMVDVAALVDDGLYITATATDPSNNTSEFSPCLAVLPPGSTTAQVEIKGAATPGTVEVGGNLAYSFIVTNYGPLPATSVVFTGILPAGFTVGSVSASQGTPLTVGDTITWAVPTLAKGSTASIVISGLAANTPGELSASATILATEVDPVLGDNSVMVTAIVVDSTPPTIDAPPDILVNTDPGLCAATIEVLGTPVTSDNIAVDSVTNNAAFTFPKGVSTVTWTATDTSGNTATATQTVTVVDNELPTLTAPADITIQAPRGLAFARDLPLGDPTASDNCGVVNVTQDAPAQFDLGTTTVTWTAVDGSGNTVTATQLVTVTSNGADLTGAWLATKLARRTRGAAAGRRYILGYFEVSNVGTGRSPRCRVNIYRSSDTVFDAGDTLISTKRVTELRTGETARVLFGSVVADGDNPQGAYLIAVIDEEGRVGDLSRTDNVVVSAPLQ